MSLVRVERPRRLALIVGALVPLVIVGSAVAWNLAQQRTVEDLLPNLEQAAPGELSGRTGGTAAAPRFYLGFESAAANTGTGPLIVLGRRPSVARERMTLRQQIARSDGTTRSVPLRARLSYVRSPDHSHWHVLRFMRYELRSADGARLMRDRKTGFCLGDRYRVAYAFPDRPAAPRFGERCGKGAPRLLTMREGISIGWGDNYNPHLEGQEFEVTSLAAGRYVLVHRVNSTNDFRESDYADNVASMAFDLSWPRGRKQPPRIDVAARCPRTATCP